MQTEEWKRLVGLGIILAGAGNATLLLGFETAPYLAFGPLGLGIVFVLAGLANRPHAA